jgi:hypothetical protein
MIVTDHHSLVETTGWQAIAAHRKVSAILGTGVEEAPVLDRPLRAQNAAFGTLQDVVAGVVTEAAKRRTAADRALLGGITASTPRRSRPPCTLP